MSDFNAAKASMPSPTVRRRLVASLINLASVASGVRPTIIQWGGRTDQLARLRWAVMYALRHMGERSWSYPTIAGHFLMDHTTVMHGVKRAERMMAHDEEYSTFVAALVQRARHG